MLMLCSHQISVRELSGSCQAVFKQRSAWSGSPQIQNCQKLVRFVIYFAWDNSPTTQRLKNPIRRHIYVLIVLAKVGRIEFLIQYF
jgi:hypothetical protein